jgi:hypothetical protein
LLSRLLDVLAATCQAVERAKDQDVVILSRLNVLTSCYQDISPVTFDNGCSRKFQTGRIAGAVKK